MANVVIVQRNRTNSLRYALWLSRQGHTYGFCNGPSAPLYRCTFQKEGACSYWESSDLLIYDPWLDNDRHEANSEELVWSLRQRYPDKPLILVGPQQVTPSWVDRVLQQDPLVRAVFPASAQALGSAVEELLAERATWGPRSSSHPTG